MRNYQNNFPRSIAPSSPDMRQIEEYNEKSINDVISRINLELIPVWSITGTLCSRNVRVDMREYKTLINKNITISMMFMFSGQTALNV